MTIDVGKGIGQSGQERLFGGPFGMRTESGDEGLGRPQGDAGNDCTDRCQLKEELEWLVG